jgi:glycerate kinase
MPRWSGCRSATAAPGTLEALVAAGFQRVPVAASGPTGEPVAGAIAVDGTRAFVEMAEASGLKRLPGGRRAPLEATTYGTGELLRAALDHGAREIVLGVGGSATTDGGAGMAAALGARLLDQAGTDLPPGGRPCCGWPGSTSPASTRASPRCGSRWPATWTTR